MCRLEATKPINRNRAQWVFSSRSARSQQQPGEGLLPSTAGDPKAAGRRGASVLREGPGLCGGGRRLPSRPIHMSSFWHFPSPRKHRVSGDCAALQRPRCDNLPGICLGISLVPQEREHIPTHSAGAPTLVFQSVPSISSSKQFFILSDFIWCQRQKHDSFIALRKRMSLTNQLFKLSDFLFIILRCF